MRPVYGAYPDRGQHNAPITLIAYAYQNMNNYKAGLYNNLFIEKGKV